MTEKTFNKALNVSLLAGMTLAVLVATVLRFPSAQDGRFLLLVSAFSSLMGILSAVCSANGLIITFLFGLLDVSLYGVVCLLNWKDGGAGLGNALLHFVYFVPMQFVGFFQWRRRGHSEEGAVRARRLTPRGRLLTGVAFLVAGVAAYLLLLHFDRSGAQGFWRWTVLLDVLPLICNIIGQILLSAAYMEQWIFWIGVNIFSIAMWGATMKNAPDASYALIYLIKYTFYLVNSCNGLRIWLSLSAPERRLDK
ncbi:MAG: nicotinamide mononucleotide transporter [Bacteroidales bacterium]|nr:nicotinamide mononucleotide transporter [Bacteroidales bacterium]